MKRSYKFIAVLLIFSGMISCQKTPQDEIGTNDFDDLSYYNFGSEFFHYDLPLTEPEKVCLEPLLIHDYLLVGFVDEQNSLFDQKYMSKIENDIDQIGLFKPVDWNLSISALQLGDETDYHYWLLLLQTKEKKTYSQLKEIIELLEKETTVAYVNLTFEAKNNECLYGCTDMNIMGSYPFFMVRVEDDDNLSDLFAVMEKTNTFISGKYSKNIYYIMTYKNSKGNAVQMANYFYNTGKFTATNPQFYYSNIPVTYTQE